MNAKILQIFVIIDLNVKIKMEVMLVNVIMDIS